jgi:hypothetical protein
LGSPPSIAPPPPIAPPPARAVDGADRTGNEREGALLRLFEHFRSTAASAGETAFHRGPRAMTGLSGPWDTGAATSWLEAERRNLLAVAEAAVDIAPDCTMGVSTALAAFLDARGYYADAMIVHAAAARAATAGRDLAGQGAALGRLGVIIDGSVATPTPRICSDEPWRCTGVPGTGAEKQPHSPTWARWAGGAVDMRWPATN